MNEYNQNDKSDAKINEMLDMSGGMGSFEKPKDMKKVVKNLVKYSKKYLLKVIVAIIFAIGGTVLALIAPDGLSQMTDTITQGLISGINMSRITNIGLIIILIYTTSSVLAIIQGYIMATVSQKLSKELRTGISKKINRLPLSFFNNNTTGDILSRITNDVDSLGQNLNQSVPTFVASITMFAGSIIMMFKTNWVMALTAIISSIVGFVAMIIIMTRSQKYFDGNQKYLGEINGLIEETYSGYSIVSAYNAEKQMKDEFDKINRNLKKHGFMSQFLAGMMLPIMTLVDNLGYVAIILVGALLASKGYISFGVIVAFLVYVRYFTQPLAQIAQIAQGLQVAAASGERVFEFLEAEEMEEERTKTNKIKEVKGAVTFENVKFGYDENKMIINDFSATALPGQKVAIVGPTGAGKTTLVNLLMKFYNLNGGEIFIDSVPISTMTRAEVHSLFCMVLQDTWLFEGSVRENIAYSKTGISDEDVKKACKAVGIHHFITTLPQGYDTILDDKITLSIGQKQQLTIARAMVEDAPMLILDEATSSVDTRTELHIQQAMDMLMENRTSFVIAHRLSTIKNADLILVLKDGDIIESGNHDQLLIKNGFYAEMYNSQFEAA